MKTFLQNASDRLKALAGAAWSKVKGLLAGGRARLQGYARRLQVRLRRLFWTLVAGLVLVLVAEMVWRHSPALARLFRAAGPVLKAKFRRPPAFTLVVVPSSDEAEEIPARPVPDGRL